MGIPHSFSQPNIFRAAGITNPYGTDGLLSKPGGREFFHTRSGQHPGPYNLMYNG